VYRRLAPAAQVDLDWERADQDGFAYRALRVWPAGQDPAERPAGDGEPNDAYESALTIEWNPAD
jgi:CspA family cold shock protein